LDAASTGFGEDASGGFTGAAFGGLVENASADFSGGLTGAGAPHLWQNFALSLISVPHFLQNMPFPPCQMLLQIASTISL
jgi:hypothetical protein